MKSGRGRKKPNTGTVIMEPPPSEAPKTIVVPEAIRPAAPLPFSPPQDPDAAPLTQAVSPDFARGPAVPFAQGPPRKSESPASPPWKEVRDDVRPAKAIFSTMVHEPPAPAPAPPAIEPPQPPPPSAELSVPEDPWGLALREVEKQEAPPPPAPRPRRVDPRKGAYARMAKRK